jgi:hypothetical protein
VPRNRSKPCRTRNGVEEFKQISFASVCEIRVYVKFITILLGNDIFLLLDGMLLFLIIAGFLKFALLLLAFQCNLSIFTEYSAKFDEIRLICRSD